MKRKLFVGVIIVLLLIVTVGGMSSATVQPKVTLCHATSSASNPWVRTVVSANAISGHFENNGTTKAGHESDVLLQGEQDCPAPPVVPTDPVREPEPEVLSETTWGK